MGTYIDTQIRTIDACLSIANDNRRIIWIQSWDRSSLKKALNFSSAIFGKIMQKCTNSTFKTDADNLSNGYFDFLIKNGLISEYTQYISADKNDLNKKRAIGIYLNDFQIHTADASAILHRFLTNKIFFDKILLLGSVESSIPIGFEDEIITIKLNAPTVDDIRKIIENNIKNNPLLVDSISKGLAGYSEYEVRSIMHTFKVMGLLNDNETSKKQRETFLIRYRTEKLTKDGTLKIEWLSKKDDIGTGMINYAKWLTRHKISFFDLEYSISHGIPAAKGVFMTGLPGTGKTVMAKSTAVRLNLPYVELNMDEMSTSHYGESEKLLRKYIDKVNSLGRAVVCIDEIEKSLGKDSKTMHEVKSQQLQMLLKWMQQSTDKFFFITCNNMDSLPPELLRDGRLAERFYVFMPTANELSELFFSFLEKLNLDADRKLYDQKMMNEKSCKTRFIHFLTKLVTDACSYSTSTQDPFMTGANLKKLIEETNLALAYEDKKISLPYNEDIFFKKMYEVATSKDFTFFGESNFTAIADLWLYVRNNKLVCVSDSYMVNPFDSTYNERERKFEESSIVKPDKNLTYENWFEYRFKVRMNTFS